MHSDTSNIAANAGNAIDYKSFAAGDPIIVQGESTRNVYALIEGYADAYQNDNKVGEINPGEMFGAIAAFTGSKRNATIVARTDCVVRSIRHEDFTKLIETQPELSLSLK